MSNLLKLIIITLIKGYQKIISPHRPGCCRFYPTCSEYSIQAITKFGVFKGTVLSITRLLRCNPLGGYGYDPIPEQFSLNPLKLVRRN